MELPRKADVVKNSLLPPPMFITIGPQCSGKTTFLKNLSTVGLTVVDITLDDQYNVYIPVDTRFFLYRSLEDPSISKDDRTLLQRQIQGKTIAYRIFEEGGNDELRLVLQRLQGLINATFFARGIRKVFNRLIMNGNDNNNDDEPNNNDDYKKVEQELIQVVERFATKKVQLSETTLLFIVESLFRPSDTQTKTGIEMAAEQLETASKQNDTVAVAWGNTNARPRDYRCALDIASSTGRPVIFITNGEICGAAPEYEHGVQLALTPVPFSTLLQRNVERLLQTGKYVPSKSIWDSLQRTTSLLVTASEQAKRQKRTAQEASTNVQDEGDPKTEILHLELDQQLARFVNFEMSTDRTVQPLPYQPPTRQERPRRNNEGDGSRGNLPYRSQRLPQPGFPQNGKYATRGETYPNRRETSSHSDNNRQSGYSPPGSSTASGRAAAGRYNFQSRNPSKRSTHPTNRDMTSSWNNRGHGTGDNNTGRGYQQPRQQQQRQSAWSNPQRNPSGGRRVQSALGQARSAAYHAGRAEYQQQQRQNPWFNAQRNVQNSMREPPTRDPGDAGDHLGGSC